MANTTTNAVAAAPQEKALTYQSAGMEVRLTKSIVRRMLCKGNADFTDEHLNQFMLMCQFNQVNPFLGEAYLTGYKTSGGGSEVAMIVSKEALMKRAEACPEYDGLEAGVIVRHQDGTLEDMEGNFYEDTDRLVGGWAKVYRRDRKHPITAKVRLSEFDKGRATWKSMPGTMIAKVAKVQALREAFPAQLGAMYTQEERTPIAEEAEAVEILDERKTQALQGGKTVDMETGEVLQEEESAAAAPTVAPF